MSAWLDLLGALFLLAGAFLAFAAAVALVRFPDLLSKMHAITKPQVLGLLFVATGLFLTFRTWWVFIVCTLIVGLQLITSPVSATMVSRSAYRSGQVDTDIMVMDELADELSRAGYEFTDREQDYEDEDEEPDEIPVEAALDPVGDPGEEAAPGDDEVITDPMFEGAEGEDVDEADGTTFAQGAPDA